MYIDFVIKNHKSVNGAGQSFLCKLLLSSPSPLPSACLFVLAGPTASHAHSLPSHGRTPPPTAFRAALSSASPAINRMSEGATGDHYLKNATEGSGETRVSAVPKQYLSLWAVVAPVDITAITTALRTS